MSNAILALSALGAVGLIVAASGSQSDASVPRSALAADSREMVEIFNLYSKRRTELTGAELSRLAELNAKAKGIPLQSIADVAREFANKSPYPGEVNYTYRKRFYLPPGVATETDPTQLVLMRTMWRSLAKPPDAFSVWGDEFTEKCEAYMAGGYCMDGLLLDFFGRPVGGFHNEPTVYGKSDLEGIAEGIGDMWESAGGTILHEVAAVASNYPGIGTAISVAITALEQLGSGASVSDAIVASGRAAIPSVYRSAYDIGVGIVVSGEVDVSAIADIAMAAAISSGAISGDVLERYDAIMDGYNTAKDAVGTLSTAVSTIV